MNGNLIKLCIEKKTQIFRYKCSTIVDNRTANCLILIKEKMQIKNCITLKSLSSEQYHDKEVKLTPSFFNFYCIDLFSNNQNTKNTFIPSN